MCNMSYAMWYEGIAQLLSLTKGRREEGRGWEREGGEIGREGEGERG